MTPRELDGIAGHSGTTGHRDPDPANSGASYWRNCGRFRRVAIVGEAENGIEDRDRQKRHCHGTILFLEAGRDPSRSVKQYSDAICPDVTDCLVPSGPVWIGRQYSDSATKVPRRLRKSEVGEPVAGFLPTVVHRADFHPKLHSYRASSLIEAPPG
jgi:hypothetical protein